jgi:hypothetical protein
LVKATIAKLPPGSEIVAGFDADEGGRKLVEVIRLVMGMVATETGRTDLIFKVHLPAEDGGDWNQILQERSLYSPPHESARRKKNDGYSLITT